MLIFSLKDVLFSTSFEGLCRFRVHLTIEMPLIRDKVLYNVLSLIVGVVRNHLHFIVPIHPG